MANHKRPAESLHEVDPLIPILNLVCMLIPLLIFGAVFVSYHTLAVSAPPGQGAAKNVPPTTEKLNLSVMITDQGFHFKVNPKHRLVWMVAADEIAESGPDIPKKDDAYDFAALEDRLIEIKARHPGEHRILLGAEDEIAYDVIIKTMDASRGPKSERFPLVQLVRGIIG